MDQHPEQDESKSLVSQNDHQIQPAHQQTPEIAKGGHRQRDAIVIVTPTKEELFFIKRRWEGRVAHPRKLIASTKAALEDLGYSVQSSYNDETSPMRDTSYFEATMLARFDQKKTNYGIIALGVATLPLIVGYWIIKAAHEIERSLIKITFEGEAYYVGARESRLIQENVPGRSAHAERAGVVSDIRMSLKAGVGPANGEDGLKDGVYSQKSELVDMTNNAADELNSVWKDQSIA